MKKNVSPFCKHFPMQKTFPSTHAIITPLLRMVITNQIAFQKYVIFPSKFSHIWLHHNLAPGPVRLNEIPVTCAWARHKIKASRMQYGRVWLILKRKRSYETICEVRHGRSVIEESKENSLKIQRKQLIEKGEKIVDRKKWRK